LNYPYEDLKPGISPKVIANKYYDDVKSYFNDLQSLGQFTEQYGARGTYDNFLEHISKNDDILNDIKQNLLFIARGGGGRNHLSKEKTENLKIIYNILQRRSTMSTNAELMSDTAGRGISNKQLLKSAKEETNLGIFKDAKVSFKGKDGKAYSAMCVNMELMFGMFEYSKTNPIADMNFASFITWVKQGKRFNNLLQMVKQDTSLLELTFGKATMLSGSDVADLANEMDVFKGSLQEQDVLDVKALKEIMERGQAIVSKLDKVDALSKDKISDKVKAFQSNKKESK